MSSPMSENSGIGRVIGPRQRMQLILKGLSLSDGAPVARKPLNICYFLAERARGAHCDLLL